MSRSKNTIIACYSLDGDLVRTYPTAKYAAKARGVFHRTIDRATRDDVLTVKGYRFKRVNIDAVPTKIEPLQKSGTTTQYRPVAKIDENGKILETYPSLNKAAKSNQIDSHTLRDRISGKYEYVGKAKFRYLLEDELEQYGYVFGGEFSNQKKPVIQLDLSGKYIKTFKSIGGASKALGKSSQGIKLCLSGKYRSAYGYMWKYKDQENVKRVPLPKVYQIGEDGKTINTYKSVRDASTSTSVSISSINNVIGGRQKTAGGFIWKKK